MRTVVQDAPWPGVFQVTNGRNGGVVLRLKIPDLGEVKRWLIGFGANNSVVKPVSLHRKIAAECTRTAHRIG